MAVREPSASHEETVPGGDRPSLRKESRAAAEAAAAHVRKVAATAGAEARLSVVSLVATVVAGLLAVFLLLSAWLFLLASGVSLAVEEGMPLFMALLAAAGINVAGTMLFLFWCSRLLKNVGFARTSKLILPGRQ